jgi:hypothetical protein
MESNFSVYFLGIFYHEIGFSHFPPLERGQFKFPYLCEADAVKVPEWAKSTEISHLFRKKDTEKHAAVLTVHFQVLCGTKYFQTGSGTEIPH